MIYELIIQPKAERELSLHHRAGNKILLTKIYKLLKELEEHPETGTGKPHLLKGDKKGIWSRSIDGRHRMLYVIDKNRVIVFVISLWGHYDDK